MSDFAQSLIPIALTGKDWFVLASVLADKRVRAVVADNAILSLEGATALARAKRTIAEALERASLDLAASEARKGVVVPFSGREV